MYIPLSVLFIVAFVLFPNEACLIGLILLAVNFWYVTIPLLILYAIGLVIFTLIKDFCESETYNKINAFLKSEKCQSFLKTVKNKYDEYSDKVFMLFWKLFILLCFLLALLLLISTLTPYFE
jgi:hypothetical protein